MTETKPEQCPSTHGGTGYMGGTSFKEENGETLAKCGYCGLEFEAIPTGFYTINEWYLIPRYMDYIAPKDRLNLRISKNLDNKCNKFFLLSIVLIMIVLGVAWSNLIFIPVLTNELNIVWLLSFIPVVSIVVYIGNIIDKLTSRLLTKYLKRNISPEDLNRYRRLKCH